MKLDNKDVIEKMKDLSGWKVSEQFIEKKFEFKDFSTAFAFISRIALLSEKLDHHPDWSGVYNKVNIKLSTHSAKGITNKDIEMATEIDKLIQ